LYIEKAAEDYFSAALLFMAGDLFSDFKGFHFWTAGCLQPFLKAINN